MAAAETEVGHPCLTPYTRHTDPGSRKEMWHEHDACRTGIVNYDDHLHRIRSWNITLTTILVGGYLGINLQAEPRITPGVAILAISLINCLFWLLDGLNKSLQMVHINNSRNIEAILRGEDIPYFGPMLGLAFEKKQERHLRPALKNLCDQSIWPFYVLPGLVSLIIISFQSGVGDGCSPLTTCRFSDDALYGLAGPAFQILLLVISFSREGKVEHFAPYDGARRRLLLTILTAELKELKAKEEAGSKTGRVKVPFYRLLSLEKTYVFPFSADFSIGKFLIFVDSVKVADNDDYRRMRARLLNNAGFTVLALSPKDYEVQFEAAEGPWPRGLSPRTVKKRLCKDLGFGEERAASRPSEDSRAFDQAAPTATAAMPSDAGTATTDAGYPPTISIDN